MHQSTKPNYLFTLAALFLAAITAVAQIPTNPTTAVEALPASPFRVGERLTYSITFERFPDVAFAEMHVVSRGRLSDRDAIEIRARIKTLDMLNAAFYNVDETRTVFASAETGMPLHVTKSLNNSATPKESVADFLTSPAANFDLVTLIYRLRANNSPGPFSFFEGERVYAITHKPAESENIRVPAGQYDTTATIFDSPYFAESGISPVRINFTNDSERIPVLIRFRTQKGNFRVELSGAQYPQVKSVSPPVIESAPAVQPPTGQPLGPNGQPIGPNGPRPVATPAPYVDNVPLNPDVGFVLGEALDYRITTGGRAVATARLHAASRKLFRTNDALLLTAQIIAVEPGNPAFVMNDSINTYVNPETLAPILAEMKFNGPLRTVNQTAGWDARTGNIMAGTTRVEAPVGTHSLVSLLYALRSFNLRRSADPKNPVNDTRVSVFFGGRSHVFSLRPSSAELIDIRGEKVPAQLITINTGDNPDPLLAGLNLRVWLSAGEGPRIPLRIALGNYQADLFAQTIIPPQ